MNKSGKSGLKFLIRPYFSSFEPKIRTLITFIQPNKSFLPGLQAYQRFFTEVNIPFQVIQSEEISGRSFDIEWHFMGKDFRPARPANSFIIHEYCSLSVPPLAKVKNIWKRIKSLRPDIRIFSNQLIGDEFNFQDGIPAYIREVGVDTGIFKPAASGIEKKYDFIYVGTVDKTREMNRLLDYFTNAPMNSSSLLIVSRDYDQLEKKYKKHSNIHFEGPVTASAVAERIAISRYAINYIPEVYPFNLQASTKLLEYVACKVPVLTTHSHWIRQFERQVGGNYYYFNDKQPYFHPDDLSRFEFSFPELDQLSWDKIIIESGILQDLYRRFPALFANCAIKDKLG